MKTKEQKTREAVKRLKDKGYHTAAGILEEAIEKGSIILKPGKTHIDHLIFAALVFSDAKFMIDPHPTYTFETK